MGSISGTRPPGAGVQDQLGLTLGAKTPHGGYSLKSTSRAQSLGPGGIGGGTPPGGSNADRLRASATQPRTRLQCWTSCSSPFRRCSNSRICLSCFNAVSTFCEVRFRRSESLSRLSLARASRKFSFRTDSHVNSSLSVSLGRRTRKLSGEDGKRALCLLNRRMRRYTCEKMMRGGASAGRE